MKLEWDAYEFILLLSRLKSLTMVANELKINQSTASRRLKNIEEKIGAPIFRLTEDGYAPNSLCLPLIQSAESIENILTQNILEPTLKPKQKIRITTVDFIFNFIIAPHLKELSANGQIELEFEISNQTKDPKRNSFDFAIRLARPQHLGKLKMRSLGKIHYVIGHLKTNNLQHLKWAALTEELNELPDQKFIKIKTDISLRVASYQNLLSAISYGPYKALLPQIIVSQSKDIISHPGPKLERSVWLLMKDNIESYPEKKHFRDKLVQIFNSFS